MSLTPGTRIGSYEVASKLGEGGMGEVYRARDSKLKREVAIKVLPADVANDRERLARFQREAEVLASLNHPHIAHVYGIEDPSAGSGQAALVMELVEGEDLSRLIASGTGSRGPGTGLPIGEALAIAQQIAEALEAAHDAGIVHRDLKPANIKVREDGTVKVLDFGLAKAYGQDLKTSHLRQGSGGQAGPQDLALSPTITSPAMTMRGVILGTAAYMSPEQAKGKPVDRRADIWAFGCVLFEMLTGRKAFDGEDVTDTIAAVVTKEPDWSLLPASTPPQVTRVLQRCLVKDRRQRLRDIGDARHDLMDTAAPVVAPIQVRSSRIAFFAAAAALVVASLLALPAFSHWREAARSSRTLRLDISAPPGTARLVSHDITGDGRSIVFTAATGGQLDIWTRRLSEPAAIRIDGISGQFPFWSPDGRSFAFQARSGVVIYDLDSNTSRVVATFGSTLGTIARFLGAWSRESGIVFGFGSSIYRVTDDREPQLVTFDGLPANADNRYPTFLPDGRHLLFLSGDESARYIHVAPLDGGAAKKLFAAESQAVYSEPAPGRGHLLFMQNGNLMARPFDPVRLEPGGEPFILAADVPHFSSDAIGTGRGQFAASRDGVVVYMSQAMVPTTRLTWFDRAGKELNTVGEPALYFGPRISPDGRQIAAVRLDPRTRVGDIHVLDEKGHSRRLSFDPGGEVGPVWMPSGDAVIYGSQRNGKSQLFRKRADGGGGEELLYESQYSVAPDDVSADGAYVLFRESRPDTQNDLWVLPLDGSGKAKPILQTEADEPRARFSPDGKLVTYFSTVAGSRTLAYAMTFPDASSKWQISDVEAGTMAQWRGDQKEIYYVSAGPPPALYAQTVLSSVPLHLGERTLLFRTPGTARGSFFHATPDGQRFLFAVIPPEPDLLKYHVAIDWLKNE